MKIKNFVLLLLVISGCKHSGPPQTIYSRNARLSSQKDWGLASSVYIGSSNISDNSVEVRSLWDEDSLYFRFDVQDKDLWATQTERDDKELYLDDMCEVLLDPRRDSTDLWLEDDIIYHVNLLGTVKDDRGEPGGGQNVGWNGEARCCVSLSGTLNDSTDIDEGYSIEIAIPWAEIGIRPVDGLKINVNFGCGDRDSKNKEKCLIFMNDYFPTRTPSSFSTLQLTL